LNANEKALRANEKALNALEEASKEEWKALDELSKRYDCFIIEYASWSESGTLKKVNRN
jgi:hypothetical protein